MWSVCKRLLLYVVIDSLRRAICRRKPTLDLRLNIMLLFLGTMGFKGETVTFGEYFIFFQIFFCMNNKIILYHDVLIWLLIFTTVKLISVIDYWSGNDSFNRLFSHPYSLIKAWYFQLMLSWILVHRVRRTVSWIGERKRCKNWLRLLICQGVRELFWALSIIFNQVKTFFFGGGYETFI